MCTPSWEGSHIPSQSSFLSWWFSGFPVWWDMGSFPPSSAVQDSEASATFNAVKPLESTASMSARAFNNKRTSKPCVRNFPMGNIGARFTARNMVRGLGVKAYTHKPSWDTYGIYFANKCSSGQNPAIPKSECFGHFGGSHDNLGWPQLRPL